MDHDSTLLTWNEIRKSDESMLLQLFYVHTYMYAYIYTH